MSQPQEPPSGDRSYFEQRIRSLRNRAPLLWLLAPFIAGLALAKNLPGAVALPVGWWLAGALALTVGAMIAVFASPQQGRAAGIVVRVALGAMVFGIFLSGVAAYEIHRTRLDVYDSLPPREAKLTLRITHIFSVNQHKTGPANGAGAKSAVKYPQASGLARVTDAPRHLRELIGQPVYFSAALPQSLVVAENDHDNACPPVIRTAEITVTGLLTPLPRNAAADGFDGYLTASGMNFKLTRGRILALEKNASATAVFYERARLRFSEILGAGLGNRPKQAGTLRAMTLGQKQEIDEEQTALFLGSGTMHLFAISGLHIVVIATGIQFILLLLRLPRPARMLLGIAALYLYVQITGASPSAMRAFVMIAIFQAAFMLRRPGNGIATLALAALVTLLVAPMLLFSASFQMSYGIVAALLLYGLPLADRWLARWELYGDIPASALTLPQRALRTTQRYLLGVTGIGVAASLVSAICGTIYFKLFTPGALLANLLLIPAAMLVVLAGFLSIIFGLLGLTPVSILFNHAAALVLLSMEHALAFFLKIPGVSLPAQFAAPWLGYAALALLLAAMLFGYAKKWSLRSGGFWPPVAVVAAALLFCVRFL